jgi:hypothetical protein
MRKKNAAKHARNAPAQTGEILNTGGPAWAGHVPPGQRRAEEILTWAAKDRPQRTRACARLCAALFTGTLAGAFSGRRLQRPLGVKPIQQGGKLTRG